MKQTIAIIGPPFSGKTKLAQLYNQNSINLGEYAHSLPPTNSLRKECSLYWQEGKTFSGNLVLKLLEKYPLSDESWLLLDGTPRNLDQVLAIESFFGVIGFIELNVELSIWMDRVKNDLTTRSHREDSTLGKLIQRRLNYFEEVEKLRAVSMDWDRLDNSKDFEITKEKFEILIKNILKRRNQNERIYGYSR